MQAVKMVDNQHLTFKRLLHHHPHLDLGNLQCVLFLLPDLDLQEQGKYILLVLELITELRNSSIHLILIFKLSTNFYVYFRSLHHSPSHHPNGPNKASHLSAGISDKSGQHHLGTASRLRSHSQVTLILFIFITFQIYIYSLFIAQIYQFKILIYARFIILNQTHWDP